MGFLTRQGLLRVVAVGVLGCLPALAETQSPAPGSVFTESDRQNYRACASETNENASCSAASGVDKSRVATKASGQFRQGSSDHWKCLSRKLNSCMTKKGMSADAKGYVKDRMKLWRMLRPNRARIPDQEDVLLKAVGKDFDAAKKNLSQRYFDNPDFKSCLKDARSKGLSLDEERISAEEFKSGKDDSGESIPLDDIRGGLVACADKKKAERDLASKPDGTPSSGSGGTSNTRNTPPPPNNVGGDQPIFSTGASSAAP